MELAVGALGACTGCCSFFFSNGQTLRQYLFDFDENKIEFEKKKRDVEAKKADYEEALQEATENKMKAKNDVDNWYSDYKVKKEEWDRLVIDLGRNSGRRCCPCKIKLNKKLLKMTKQMTELIDRYNKFRSCMFIEDLNRQILDNFEATKSKFEALTAFRSLEQVSDQSDGIEKWRQEYVEMKRKCDGIENKLKNYNTEEGESINVGMEDLENKTKEMMELTNRYNQFFSFQKIKKEFDAMINTYRMDRKLAEKDGKIPRELVREWMEDCEILQKKYGHGNTEIQADAESSHRQQQLIRQMEEMENLITRYNRFNGFSNMFVDQPLETVVKRSIEYKPLNSMENNKERVYAALKDEMVIRLFGMGGVGKTTLMRQINDEMSNSSYFKLVIWVTVSTTFADIKSIQDKISRRLELKVNDSEDIFDRAKKISEYLKSNVDGNVLFIFDDVWEMLELNKIGIPCGTYGDDERKCCKIVLTTRDRSVQVIHPMRPKDIEVKGLDEDESWILFKINASIEDNIDDGIKEIAKNICRKCVGLPLVITVIAKMLYRKEEKAIWSETLTFLNKKDASRYIPNLSNDVYIPLRLSYDRLEREDLKIGFLLCSLFPEDYKIAVSDLLYYGLGAGEIAEGCQSFDACHNIFIHLKNKGLLQDGYNDEYSARMHDVIRDVAHFIAKKEFEGFFCNAELKWISSVQNSSLGMENVLSLDLRTQTSTSLQADTTKSFIKKLNELRVLMFPKYVEDEEIPVNIKEYFILHNLSVLCLQYAYIEELDKDFSIELCNLRVIDFLGTMIDVIRPKVFSNLHNKLEVLHMLMSFDKWQASDEEDGEYVRFAELAELKKLYSLQVQIKDREILSHEYRPDLVFSSVEYFSINPPDIIDENCYLKELYLSNIQVWNGAKWIKDLLKKSTNHLGIFEEKDEKDDKEFSVVLTQDIQDIISSMCNLETLELYDFPSCKHVIQYSSDEEGHHCTSKPILPKVKVLSIDDFSEMENIFVRTLTPTVIPKGSFEKLLYIQIWSCSKLKFIFPWNVATCLVQLKTLSIKFCDQLEVIIEKEDNGDYNNQGEYVLFPELTGIELYRLPKLEYVLSRSDKKLKNLKQQFLLSESSAPNLEYVHWERETFRE